MPSSTRRKKAEFFAVPQTRSFRPKETWSFNSNEPLDSSFSIAAFVELALTAWRSTNSAGRKALREHLKEMVAKSA